MVGCVSSKLGRWSKIRHRFTACDFTIAVEKTRPSQILLLLLRSLNGQIFKVPVISDANRFSFFPSSIKFFFFFFFFFFQFEFKILWFGDGILTMMMMMMMINLEQRWARKIWRFWCVLGWGLTIPPNFPFLNFP